MQLEIVPVPVPAGGRTAWTGAGDRERGLQVSGDYGAPRFALGKDPNPIYLSLSTSSQKPQWASSEGDRDVL